MHNTLRKHSNKLVMAQVKPISSVEKCGALFADLDSDVMFGKIRYFDRESHSSATPTKIPSAMAQPAPGPGGHSIEGIRAVCPLSRKGILGLMLEAY